MQILRGAAFALCLATFSAVAQDAPYLVLLGVDVSDAAGVQEQSLGAPLAPSMSAAMQTRVQVKQTTNMTDVMRATRAEENDIVIGPPHVTASAISHGYLLLACNVRTERFVLVARREIGLLSELAAKRVYLTQPDSARTYFAKGMLREAGFDMNGFQKVTYARTSGAGLLALESNLSDLTVAEEGEAKRWMEAHPGVGKILKTTREVPAGMAIVVKKSMQPAERKALMAWVNSAVAYSAGLGRLREVSGSDKDQYNYIAALGI